MRQYIRSHANDCESCQKHARINWKPSLSSRDIPSIPWQYLAADLFQYNNTMYLFVVDYFSNFPVVFKLTRTINEVIMKFIFSILGTPTIIYTDNVPQFPGPAFLQFTKNVQYIKNIIKKSNNYDLEHALLTWRNNPSWIDYTKPPTCRRYTSFCINLHNRTDDISNI